MYLPKIMPQSTGFCRPIPDTLQKKCLLIATNLLPAMKPENLQEKILVLNNDYLLSSSTAGNILYQEHFRPHVLSRMELKEILSIIASGSFSFYLIKVNNGSILPSEDLAWVEKLNLLRLYKAGITFVAYVSPRNIFNSLEMEKEVKPGKILQIRIFRKVDDALLWFDQQDFMKPTYP